MFEVTVKTETFVFDNFDEIAEFFAEVVNALGAEDAEITVKFANPSND